MEYFITIHGHMVSNIESSPNNELDLALNDAISAFHAEEKNLEQMIKKEDNFRNAYKKINLHYDTSVFPKGWKDIILKMKKSDADKNSLEWSLLKNEQIQHLFASIVSSHITSRNERLERVIEVNGMNILKENQLQKNLKSFSWVMSECKF